MVPRSAFRPRCRLTFSAPVARPVCAAVSVSDRDLGRDGLITRHVFPTKPPSVEYRLAPLGQSLLEPMASLVDCADRCHGDIHAARARFEGRPGDAPRQAFPARSKVPLHSTNRQGWTTRTGTLFTSFRVRFLRNRWQSSRINPARFRRSTRASAAMPNRAARPATAVPAPTRSPPAASGPRSCDRRTRRCRTARSRSRAATTPETTRTR